ncbi:MAG: M81 family metallopeptidase, partial [Planctomycetaceae bacterium]
PHPTCSEAFRVYSGDELLAAYRGTRGELAGALDVFAQRDDLQLVPTMAADSVSGGRIAADDMTRIVETFVGSIAEQASVDAAYICFHGAMAGENLDDPEGHILQRVRKLLGDCPIVISLDLHAVITDALVQSADILVPFHTYPHVDQYETGQRAARNLLRLMTGDVRPTTVRVELPMLVRGDELMTATGRFGAAIRMCQEIEELSDGLAAGVIIGNAFTDVPALQSNVLVTTNDDEQSARVAAERIGRFMWENRALFQADLTGLDEAIRIAKSTQGLTVFSDAADATASGASGDSNVILSGLLADDGDLRALVPIVDAPAVDVAFTAGVGATCNLSLGGTRDPGRFQPLAVEARVSRLYDSVFDYEDGTQGRPGRVAVVQVGACTVLITERSVYVVGRNVFTVHGLDPQEFDVVVVKSPNGFRTWYESIAAAIVSVDVPGSTSANLKSLPFENCVRPMFPFDDDAQPAFMLATEGD